MFLVLVVSLLLAARHPGKASVLRRSAEGPDDARSAPSIRNDRCLGDPVQSVRKFILDSLDLQTEPRVSVPGMAQIREKWRNQFKAAGDPKSPEERRAAENTQPSSSSSSSSSAITNSTHLQCCKFASQVFLKDLDWDEWIIYPESFTFVQCSVCVPQQNQRSVFNCPDDDPSPLDAPSQKPCCEATSRDPVPFLYLDETSSLVISSVALSRECGCSLDDPQAL
ncbi:bone morphogenetic protein 5-like [Tachysurus fulvidraco]|uniref:bone morphogenetic protein 5-like n=1 Tax=Tachysurus fulvidraco TaxID=1234273 RepID=UPI001FF0662F|nr:bone morphogenetic protein 5-like [Tachysurus fulvidraco]